MKSFITLIGSGLQRVNMVFSCTSRNFHSSQSSSLSVHCKSFNTLFITWWSTIKASEGGQDSVLVLCSLALACSRKIKPLLWLWHNIFLCYSTHFISTFQMWCFNSNKYALVWLCVCVYVCVFFCSFNYNYITESQPKIWILSRNRMTFF